MARLSSAAPDLFYPESDGKPLADNTVQFRLIIMIQGGIDAFFQDDPNVFVAGDLFWYPVEGEPWTKQAPDVMVVFGRPKGDRRSYKQWQEGDIPPQVVFEIASESNSLQELEQNKHWFYERYGVDEYYLFDPDRQSLKGWLRQDDALVPISSMVGWISPRLGVRFELDDGQLRLYAPDGVPFATYVELAEQKRQEHLRAEQERLRAEQAEQSQQLAVPKLLAMGLSVEQIADALSLSIEEINRLMDSLSPDS